MRIAKYDNPPKSEQGHVPEEEGPAWCVREEDRDVSHVVTLRDLLFPEDEEISHHRAVAMNTIRSQLFWTLRAGMPEGALPPQEKGLTRFERAARLASQCFQRLTDYPSHDWTSRTDGEHAFSPVEIGLNNVILAAQRYRHRFDRGQTKRWWSVVITELEKVMAILRWWLK